MEKLRVKPLEHICRLGKGWQITPAGGQTGEAYIALFEGQKKLFLKRNSSPFLAVLSAEGIVPKLLWTKRMENGDVITAQHWLEGRELTPLEMNSSSVAKLLRKIHSSKELLDMLKRINTAPLTPEVIIEDIKMKMNVENWSNSLVEDAVLYLEKEVNNVEYEHKVVCHCDINHNNLLLSKCDKLYLIDWDGAMIADPALDLGMLLYWYVPEKEWVTWLNHYGITLTENLKFRMKWYAISQTVLTILWHVKREESKEVENWLSYLQQILT